MMLSDQEIINNALKQAFHMEGITAEKYAELSQQMTKPELQKLLKSMEMATRNNYNLLSKKMTDMAIV